MLAYSRPRWFSPLRNLQECSLSRLTTFFDIGFSCQSPLQTLNRHKNGPTQNRTGVLRTKISYAAPTPWNLFFLLSPYFAILTGRSSFYLRLLLTCSHTHFLSKRPACFFFLVFSLCPSCLHLYPLPFIPVLRLDLYPRLKTDWLHLPHFDFSDTWAVQSNRLETPYDAEDFLKHDLFTYDDFQDSDSAWCLLILVPDAFLPCWIDTRVRFSLSLHSLSTDSHARAHTRHSYDIKMVPPRIELGS